MTLFVVLLFPLKIAFLGKATIVILAIPLVALFGLLWLLSRFFAAMRLAANLSLIANEQIFCPSGHRVPVYGKWRCPACHAIWEGPGHRCPCCFSPMKYLVCQEPGCGMATKLPRFWR